jgi:Fe-Mn family superoxide dismutase
MTAFISRRHFITAAGLGASGALVESALGAATPPKESGLSSEGLLVGRAGFQPRTTMPLPHDEIPGFLSRRQLAASYAEYVRRAERLGEIERELERGVDDATRYAELRREQVAAGNGALLNQFYLTGLATTKVEPSRYVRSQLGEHMGSLETWQADFRRCALASRAWAALVYDPYDDRWHDVVMDSDGGGIWVGANPLVVCSVSEQAYSTDYPDRARYLDRFFDHVDWNEVARRYRAVDRM